MIGREDGILSALYALSLKSSSVAGRAERPGKAEPYQYCHAVFSLRFNPAFGGPDRFGWRKSISTFNAEMAILSGM